MTDVPFTTDARRDARIAAALAKRATVVDALAPGRWRFALSNGRELRARARVEDGWLLLDAPLGGASPTPERAWELLRWNASLDGGARFAVRAGRPGVIAAAEVPLDDDVELSRRIADACVGLQAAGARLVHGAARPPAGARGADAAWDLAAPCRESGWACVERGSGRLAVDLEVPPAFQQASVEGRGDGVAVTVPLLEAAEPGGAPRATACRDALGVLLLRLCGAVRFARAAAEPCDAVPQPRLEVALAGRPSGIELAHAFAALSVAWRIAGREAAVLWNDAGIATAYLAAWDRMKEDHDGSDHDARPAGH